MPRELNRRAFLQTVGATASTIGAHATAAEPVRPAEAAPGTRLEIDPAPRFTLSPYLYMQFMEPLGVTDSSVDAAWDFGTDQWRADVVEVTRGLAPTLLRWGGCFCSYYKWKEGVGPLKDRKPMLNQLWGGIYNNQVGTHEFVDFCRRVGADPLIVVNFEADGRKFWAVSPKGDVRSGDAREAAEWVTYCNEPANSLRRQHGVADPYGVKLWQIGNETSYESEGFSVDTAARKTIEFARAMRKVDPTVALIGWGDSGWAARMAEIAGEELQYLAFHNGFGPGGAESPLRGIEYRKDPARTWEYLMRAAGEQDRRIREMREQVAPFRIPLALTECHYVLPGRNRCEVLSTWAAGVANARILNVHERHGDVLKIATLADFCGTRWQNNALMIPVPGGRPYLMPVGLVMGLYRKHLGQEACTVTSAPEGLDVTASRTGNRVFLHVVNGNRQRDVTAKLSFPQHRGRSGRAFALAADPEAEIIQTEPDVVRLTEKPLPPDAPWTFPAASVTAVEVEI